MVTRRNVLRIAATAPLLRQTFAFSKNDFWNSKDPSQWSDKETTQMLTKSPWAKQAAVESPQSGRGQGGNMGSSEGGGMGRSGGMGSGGGMGGGGGMGSAGGMGGGGGMGGMGSGGGMGGGRGNRGGDSSGTGAPDIHALVRWETAMPVAAAEKKNTPSSDSYIVSVTGLRTRQPNANGNYPAQDDSAAPREPNQQRMLEATTLERKGKDPIVPTKAEMTMEVDGPVWRFTFPRSGNVIAPEDKDVTFVMHLGRMSLKAKFSLKEMTYKNQLAL